VVEQTIPYPELNGCDLLAETRHFGLEGPDGDVISTLRLRSTLVVRRCSGSAASGPRRVAAATGTANRLPQAALADVGEYPGHINAQTYLEEMYGRHGFIRDGAEYLYDRIAWRSCGTPAHGFLACSRHRVR
jgi:ElaA protein